MKKLVITFSALAVCICIWAFTGIDKTKDIALGSELPAADIEMLDVNSKKSFSLEDLAGQHGLLVIFSCNTCPFVLAWEDRYDDLKAKADALGIGVAVLNSNEAKRAGADSPEAMKQHANELKYEFPYLVDKDSEVATAFGATVTPQVYLFNAEKSLVYKGAIDDNMRDAEAATPHLANAMEALAKGKKIEPAETRATGCSIKKVKK